MSDDRTERDSLGEVKVPAHVHYGPQTARAAENFAVSGLRFPRHLIRALGQIKAAAAQVNHELGVLPRDQAELIAKAAGEVARGTWDEEFVVDVFQTGSGTSTNMNANEVIASRANELGGGPKGARHPIRPNDEVNKSQSSNDVMPTAIHLAAVSSLDEELLPALDRLASVLENKARELGAVVKVGRTHLMDAVPITLGQEFSGYAAQVRRSIERVIAARTRLLEVPIGGTALGTGLNAPQDFGKQMCGRLSKMTGLEIQPARNRFEAIGARDTLVEASAALRSTAVSLAKIASDIRLLASGPRAGLAEITLPALQPGSSIMPGKVNPVMPEMLIQVCAQVIGNDTAVTLGGLYCQLDLGAMMPLMAHNLLQSVSILASGAGLFAERCVKGMTADAKRCRALVDASLMAVTALVPRLGYNRAAEIAQEAQASGQTIREVVLAKRLLSAKELDSLLNLKGMADRNLKD